MYWFWRIVYAPLRWRLVIACAVWTIRIGRRIGGWRVSDFALAALDRNLVRSGWPGHPPGWINLHASEFSVRVRERLTGEAPRVRSRRAPRERRTPLRVGIYGPFAALLGFPRSLFRARPQDIELFVFDDLTRGRDASFLKTSCHRYVAMPDVSDDASFLAEASALVNDAALDLFVHAGAGRLASRLIERLTTPCVANYCAGSDLMHSANVDVEMFGQPEADYFPAAGRMFCGTTRAPFSSQLVFDLCADAYDSRALQRIERPTWRERDPLIVYHGSLYKMAASTYLDIVLDVMRQDSAVEFVFMGKEHRGELASIRDRAARHGVANRVHYEGAFSAVRDEHGDVSDEGWLRLRRRLSRARLAPNPFPMGGGSARLETYLAGVPSVHLGLRVDAESWGRFQPVICDIPVLRVPSGTAHTVEGYRELCLRCLHDEAFADRLQLEQLEIALQATDPAAWWRQLHACYAFWLSHTPVTVDSRAPLLAPALG